MIIYKHNNATTNQIYNLLTECDNNFIPKLSLRVNIIEYAEKLSNNAENFEAWEGDKLIGIVSIYIDNKEYSGFITNVSVLSLFTGKSIGTNLLKRTVFFAKQKRLEYIKLEVHKENLAAINLYNKNGFIVLKENHDIITMRHKLKFAK